MRYLVWAAITLFITFFMVFIVFIVFFTDFIDFIILTLRKVDVLVQNEDWEKEDEKNRFILTPFEIETFDFSSLR